MEGSVSPRALVKKDALLRSIMYNVHTLLYIRVHTVPIFVVLEISRPAQACALVWMEGRGGWVEVGGWGGVEREPCLQWSSVYSVHKLKESRMVDTLVNPQPTQGPWLGFKGIFQQELKVLSSEK
jgi:hypothetical protein